MTITCIGMFSFVFIQPGVHLYSWIYRLMVFINFETISFTLKIFLPNSSSSGTPYDPFFWDIYVRLMMSYKSQMFLMMMMVFLYIVHFGYFLLPIFLILLIMSASVSSIQLKSPINSFFQILYF